jgi:hypothetical protein
MRAPSRLPNTIPALEPRRTASAADLHAVTRAPRRGRPTKFGRPARAITLTLPDDVIEALSAINLDISRAVVQLHEARKRGSPPLPAPVELSDYGRGSLILITPGRALRTIRGLDLIPLSDGRALIALDEPLSLAGLELALRDALEVHEHPDSEHRALASIVEILRGTRRSRGARLRTRTIVVIEPSAPRPRRRPST